MKVGGGCLRDAHGVRQLVEVLEQAYPDSPRLLVVSAMGKTTNALFQLAEAAGRGDVEHSRAVYEEILRFHRTVVEALFPLQGLRPSGLIWRSGTGPLSGSAPSPRSPFRGSGSRHRRRPCVR